MRWLHISQTADWPAVWPARGFGGAAHRSRRAGSVAQASVPGWGRAYMNSWELLLFQSFCSGTRGCVKYKTVEKHSLKTTSRSLFIFNQLEKPTRIAAIYIWFWFKMYVTNESILVGCERSGRKRIVCCFVIPNNNAPSGMSSFKSLSMIWFALLRAWQVLFCSEASEDPHHK